MTPTDFIIGYTVILAIVCLAEAGLIGWLLWLNTILVREAEALSELIEDTGAMPLGPSPLNSHSNARTSNDHRP